LAAKWNSCVAFPQPTILCWRSFHFYLRSFLIVDHDPAPASATPPGCRKAITRIVAEQRDELAPFHCPMPPVLPTERIAHLGTADCCIHPPGRNEMIAITPPKIFSKEVAQKQATPFPRQDLLTARNRFRPNFRG